MNTIDRNKILIRYLISEGKVSNQRELGKKLGYNNESSFSQIINCKVPMPSKTLQNIKSLYPEIDINWLLTGEGEMLQHGGISPETDSRFMPDVESVPSLSLKSASNIGRQLIPFYDDIATIGGRNDMEADTGVSSRAAEWIDAGDWFPEATAAIRHYGDSMVEYPSGSVLALKRVNDRRLIINGRNYVVETSEFRITKQLQDDGGEFLMAYSSNRETYPDGRQIHAPIKIPKESVRSIDLVLGCVQKEYSSGAVQIEK